MDRLFGGYMSLYRQKPLVVNARQINGSNIFSIATWCGGTVVHDEIYIPSQDGVTIARMGYYVIEGDKGEFCPLNFSVFEQMYEEEKR